jgi:thiol-disulfide isomerase/thioredoxin
VQTETTTERGGAEGEKKTPSASPALPGAENVRLQPVSCKEWDKALASQTGTIFVVDTWATWCVPCVEEFPQLVALHEKFAKQGVACMSVSVDDADKRPKALEFLKKQGADFPNFVIDDKEGAWWDKWNIKGIPVVLVFSSDHKLVKKFDKDDPDNQFTYADVEKLVVELLKSGPGRKS